MSSFDPSCNFLLDKRYQDLFEPVGGWGGVPLHYRCKGCQQIVDGPERRAHHGAHRAGRTRSQQAAQRRAEAERLKNLEKAREAKRR